MQPKSVAWSAWLVLESHCWVLVVCHGVPSGSRVFLGVVEVSGRRALVPYLTALMHASWG